MKGYITALGLPLLLGITGAASATTATLNFNAPNMSTANTQLITNGPNGKVTMMNVGGRNAVQTGGTSDNEFLYVQLPKGLFKNSKAIWAQVEYYDQGTGTFQFHYDANGTDTTVGEGPVTEHDTKAWLTHTYSLPGADFEEMGPGGADVWLDDGASGPLTVDKIIVTDEDPTVNHWPHVDPAHPLIMNGAIQPIYPGEWDNAYSFTVNTAAQDALAGANWKGPQDFSGTYYIQWDETGVYVRGDVTDAEGRLNDAGSPGPPNYWDGDGFQLYLGLDWSDPTHSSYLDTDYDAYVGLGDGMNGSLPPSWAVEAGSGHQQVDWTGMGKPMTKENLLINNTTSPKGYQFEWYLPWTMLESTDGQNVKITAGQKIGWFFFANHSDEVGPSKQDVAMSPFARTHPSSTPSSWTTAVLEPFQAQPATNPSGTKPTAGQ